MLPEVSHISLTHSVRAGKSAMRADQAGAVIHAVHPSSAGGDRASGTYSDAHRVCAGGRSVVIDAPLTAVTCQPCEGEVARARRLRL